MRKFDFTTLTAHVCAYVCTSVLLYIQVYIHMCVCMYVDTMEPFKIFAVYAQL